MSCGVGADLALLWLWCTPPVATPVHPLVWEPPYAAGAALKRKKKKKKQGGRQKDSITKEIELCGLPVTWLEQCTFLVGLD